MNIKNVFGKESALVVKNASITIGAIGVILTGIWQAYGEDIVVALFDKKMGDHTAVVLPRIEKCETDIVQIKDIQMLGYYYQKQTMTLEQIEAAEKEFEEFKRRQ